MAILYLLEMQKMTCSSSKIKYAIICKNNLESVDIAKIGNFTSIGNSFGLETNFLISKFKLNFSNEIFNDVLFNYNQGKSANNINVKITNGNCYCELNKKEILIGKFNLNINDNFNYVNLNLND